MIIVCVILVNDLITCCGQTNIMSSVRSAHVQNQAKSMYTISTCGIHRDLKQYKSKSTHQTDSYKTGVVDKSLLPSLIHTKRPVLNCFSKVQDTSIDPCVTREKKKIKNKKIDYYITIDENIIFLVFLFLFLRRGYIF